jgi:hypothetical protein
MALAGENDLRKSALSAGPKRIQKYLPQVTQTFAERMDKTFDF